MTSVPTTRGMQPADTDVRLDETTFIDALLTLQDSIHLPSDAETAWHALLHTGYDLCFAELHDQRNGRSTTSPSRSVDQLLQTIFRNEQTQPDEHMLARLHERVLEYIPVFDPVTQRLSASEATRERRRHQGAFYTPDRIIDGLLDHALDPLLDAAEASADPLSTLLSLRICDPACGTGHFLVRAGERIISRASQHVPPEDRHRVRVHVLRECLYGAELNPISAHVCRRRLWSLAGDSELLPSLHERRIYRGSGLLGAPRQCRSLHDADAWCRNFLGDGFNTITPIHWHLLFEPGFDLVVGNPPFLNQLGASTSLARSAAELLRDRFGDSVKGYADPATIFLRMSIELVCPGGRVAMIQPQSMLATRDAHGIRQDLARSACLTSLWLAMEHVFDAAVHVCAPVFERTDERSTMLRRATGPEFTPATDLAIHMDDLVNDSTWSTLVSDLLGIPRISPTTTQTMGDMAEATADFRDQYYGIRSMVSEAPSDGADAGHVPLVTTGLIDPANCYWGHRTMRYDRRSWTRPQVDLEALVQKTKLGPWADARLVPKILLATQTRVLEVYVDEIGELLPLTPLITVVPHDTEKIWHVAVALASPITTAIAAGRYFGVARSTHAIKLAASQVLPLPLPNEGPHWDAAAEAFHAANEATSPQKRDSCLLEAAAASCRAFGCNTGTTRRFMDWWTPRAKLQAVSDPV